jgi:ABC-2 type transport system permease protein
MNGFLCRKVVSESWLQLAVSGVLLTLFSWAFVWMISLFPADAIAGFLKFMPKFVEPLVGIPLNEFATSTGRASVLFVHVITLLVCIGWAIGRGSDVVSGEITRGTMDLILALPIRRFWHVVASAAMTAFGSFVLAYAVWLGMAIGHMTVPLPKPIELHRMHPGVVNLALMTFALGGITSLFSACDRDRWRTMWLAGGLYAVSSVIKMIARLWAFGAKIGLEYTSFITPFEPQQLILFPPDVAGPLAWRYDLALLGIGLAGYTAAAIVLSIRDIPCAR